MFAPPTAIYTHGPGINAFVFVFFNLYVLYIFLFMLNRCLWCHFAHFHHQDIEKLCYPRRQNRLIRTEWRHSIANSLKNSSRVDMTLYLDTFPRFRANPSLLLHFNDLCLVENQNQFYNLWFDSIRVPIHNLQHLRRAC